MLINKLFSALDKGWSVVPVKLFPDPKKPSKIKKPASVKWLQYRDSRVNKSVVLKEWKDKLQDKPGFGYAVICGEISNLFVVDVDTEEADEKVKEFLGDLQTYTIKTPGQGYHYYFRHTDGFPNGASIGVGGLDIRSYGGYVVGEGSYYPDGGIYTVVDDSPIQRMPDPLKEYLLDCVKSNPAAKKHQQTRENDQQDKPNLEENWFTGILTTGFIEGQRVDQLKRVVGLLVGEHRSDEYIRGMVTTINRASPDPLPEEELYEQTDLMVGSFRKKEQEKQDEFDEDVLELNHQYAQITIGGKPMVMRFNEEDDGFELIQPSAMRSETKHLLKWFGKKRAYLYAIWEESPHRRRYREIIFNPSLPAQTDFINGDNGPYNMWTGFIYEPKQGDWSLFRKHIEEVLAPGHGDYVLKWFARMFQDPGGRRPGKVLVFRGKQGTGKSFTRKIIGKFFGRHYFKTDDINHLIGKFNNAVANIIFLALEEAMWAGDRSQVGRLKERITSSTISIERKGIDVTTIDSHLNIMMNSNESWVVPVQDHDRRFVVFDVSDEYRNNGEYFRAIEDQMENGGYEAMLYDMLNMKFDFQELMDSPKTNAGFDQFKRSGHPLKQFVLSLLERGTLHPRHKGWKKFIIKEKLYDEYHYFCQTLRIPFMDPKSIFYADITKYLKCEYTRKRFGLAGKGGRGNARAIVHVIQVASLQDCRDYFAQDYENVTWGDPDVEDILTDQEREEDHIDIYMDGMFEGPF